MTRRERKTLADTTEIEGLLRVIRGIKEDTSYSTFIDAYNLQDSSDKSHLFAQGDERIDYTKFGSMRKIDF